MGARLSRALDHIIICYACHMCRWRRGTELPGQSWQPCCHMPVTQSFVIRSRNYLSCVLYVQMAARGGAARTELTARLSHTHDHVMILHTCSVCRWRCGKERPGQSWQPGCQKHKRRVHSLAVCLQCVSQSRVRMLCSMRCISLPIIACMCRHDILDH